MVRLKNRWLLFELIFEETTNQQQIVTSQSTSQKLETISISTRDIYNVVKESVQNNFGDYGTGCVSTSISGWYLLLFTSFFLYILLLLLLLLSFSLKINTHT